MGMGMGRNSTASNKPKSGNYGPLSQSWGKNETPSHQQYLDSLVQEGKSADRYWQEHPNGSMADRGNFFEGPIGRIGIPAAMAVFGGPLFNALAGGGGGGAAGASTFGSTGGIGEGLGQLPTVSGALGVPGTSGVQAAAGMGGGIMDAFGGGGQISDALGGMGGGGGAIYPSSVTNTIGANGSQSQINTYGGVSPTASGAERGTMVNFSPSVSPTASFSQPMSSTIPSAGVVGAGGGSGAGVLGAAGMSIPGMSGSPTLTIAPGAGTPANSEIKMPSGTSPITSDVMNQFSPSPQSAPGASPNQPQPGLGLASLLGQGGMGGSASGVENASGSGAPAGAKQGGMGNNGALGNLIGNAANMMDKFKMPRQQQQQQQPGQPNVIQTPGWGINNNNFQFGNDMGGMAARIRKMLQLQEQNNMIQQPNMQTTQIGQQSGQPGQMGMMGGR